MNKDIVFHTYLGRYAGKSKVKKKEEVKVKKKKEEKENLLSQVKGVLRDILIHGKSKGIS